MIFIDEFVAALEAGAVHSVVLNIVQRHNRQGLTFDDIYECLHEVWLKHEFDANSEDTPLRNELEAVMEYAWYRRSGTPVAKQ